LLFLFIASTAVLIVPAITTSVTKQSAWLVPFTLPVIFGYMVLWTVCRLGNRFPGLSIVQYSEIILGKFFGKTLGVLIILFWLLINVLVIEEYTGFLSITTLPLTPPVVLSTVMVLLSLYGARQGLEVIARSAQFVLPLFVLVFIAGLILTIPRIDDLGRLLPIFEEGVGPVIRGSVVPSAWYGEIFVLVMLIPMVNKQAEIRRKGVIALVAVAIFLTIDIAFVIATFGPEMTAKFMFPLWSMFKYAGYMDFIERLEALGVIVWLTGTMIKTSMLDYLIAQTTAQVIGLKDYRSVLYILAFIEIPASVIFFRTSNSLKVFLTNYWPPIAIVFELVIPIMLLIIAVIRKKRTGVVK
jgi:spore germination protein KB